MRILEAVSWVMLGAGTGLIFLGIMFCFLVAVLQAGEAPKFESKEVPCYDLYSNVIKDQVCIDKTLITPKEFDLGIISALIGALIAASAILIKCLDEYLE